MSHAERSHCLVDGVGLWLERLTTTDFYGKPGLFLDRDGVVVEETGYLGRREDTMMIADVGETIAHVNAAGLPVILVTNQAGIARGYYSWDDFNQVQRLIEERLASVGAHFDLVLACAYHDIGNGALCVPDHPWRKPGPGMFTQALNLLGLAASDCYIVGDKLSDLQAGRSAGLSGGALTLTGHGRTEETETRAWLGTNPQLADFRGCIVPTPPQAINGWLWEVAHGRF